MNATIRLDKNARSSFLLRNLPHDQTSMLWGVCSLLEEINTPRFPASWNLKKPDMKKIEAFVPYNIGMCHQFLVRHVAINEF